jgi:hypothetical protein
MKRSLRGHSGQSEDTVEVKGSRSRVVHSSCGGSRSIEHSRREGSRSSEYSWCEGYRSSVHPGASLLLLHQLLDKLEIIEHSFWLVRLCVAAVGSCVSCVPQILLWGCNCCWWYSLGWGCRWECGWSSRWECGWGSRWEHRWRSRWECRRGSSWGQRGKPVGKDDTQVDGETADTFNRFKEYGELRVPVNEFSNRGRHCG